LIALEIDIRDNTRIKALLYKSKNLRPPLKQTGVYMLRSIDKNFQVEGRPQKWQSLAPSTLINRRKRGKGAKILQDTGIGRQSISILEITGGHISIGTTQPYMAIHQTGGKTSEYEIRPKRAKALHFFLAGGEEIFAKRVLHPGHTIPARPFLLIQDEDYEVIDNIFLDYLLKEETS